MQSKDLQKYMIPEEVIATEAASSVKELIAETLILSLVVAIGGGVAAFKRRKSEAAEKQLRDKRSADREKERLAWFSSSEGIACRQRLQKKYNEELKIDPSKISEMIFDDIVKIAKRINANKKVLKQWADEWAAYARETFAKYESDIEKYIMETTKDIMAGPCDTFPEEIEDFTWGICSLEQSSRAWLCNRYLFSCFEEPLNIKYQDEIKYGILGEFSWTGDGDEGLICTDLNPKYRK